MALTHNDLGTKARSSRFFRLCGLSTGLFCTHSRNKCRRGRVTVGAGVKSIFTTNAPELMVEGDTIQMQTSKNTWPATFNSDAFTGANEICRRYGTNVQNFGRRHTLEFRTLSTYFW